MSLVIFNGSVQWYFFYEKTYINYYEYELNLQFATFYLEKKNNIL